MAELFLKIINMSISASWLVLAVLALRFVLKKAPRWIHVLLWGIVAVRLICPFSIESALSLIPSAETIRPEIMMSPEPTIHTGVPAINSVVNPIITETFAPEPVASANPLQIWIPVLAMIWGIGVALLLAYTAISYWRLHRKVCTAVLLRDKIFQSEVVSSPFVLGVIRPRIYLPYHMDDRELAHVVAHEYAHIRRRDHWWKPLGFLLLTIHWFNPLMWVAYILLCRDIELACDEKVIKEMGNEQRADYTQALVSCSVNRRMIAACPLAFGEVGVKKRVKSVLHYQKPAFWLVAVSVTACLAAAVCFLTNPKGISVYDIISEDGYTIIDQEQVEVTLSVPKEVLSDRIYTEAGQQFKEKEVVVYQTDETVIFLEEVRVSNEREDLLYFTFGYTLDLPGSGEVIVPFSKIADGSSATIYPDDVLMSDSGPCADAVHVRGEHAGGFAFYVSADACRQAKGTMMIRAYCTKLTYAREGAATERLASAGQYYLLIGADGVASIEITGPGTGGGVVRANGSAFQKGEKVWLEPLQGVTDLKGYSITALGKNGEILYALSIPEGAANDEVINLVGSDGWLLAPTDLNRFAEEDGEGPAAAVVKWTYSPIMSDPRHIAFYFDFEFDYSHMDVSCDNGSLLNCDAKRQNAEKKLRLEAGERFCWLPETGTLTDVSEGAAIRFTAYDGGEVLYAGTLDIIRTGEENVMSFYEARLEGTDLLTLQQKAGNMGAAVIPAGSGRTAEQDEDLFIRQAQENAVWFTPEDIHDVEYMELVWHDGQRFTPLTGEGYDYIKTRLSSAKEVGATGCPYHSVLYIHRADGVVGKVLPAEDSCDVFQSGGKFYQFGDRADPPYYDSNKTFYKHFGTSVSELPNYISAPEPTEPGSVEPYAFTNILGCDGYVVSDANGPHNLRSYYAVAGNQRWLIAETFGFGGAEDYVVDLDGDGITELVANVTFGGDGARRAYVYQRRGDEIYLGTLSAEGLPNYRDWGVNSTWSEYEPSTGIFRLHYAQKNSDDYGVFETKALDRFRFDAFSPVPPVVTPLTDKEVARFNETFNPLVYDKQGDPIGVNPWSCFFTSYYDDVRDLNFVEFMRYFTGDGSFVSDEEFAALVKLETFPFYGEVSTRADMPVPVSRYPARLVNQVLKEYAGITTADLDTSGVEYLSRYDAFYNYTSDFGPGMFTCTRGEVAGDIVRLYEELESGTDMLTLRKTGSSYRIVAHQRLSGDNGMERHYG